MHLQVAPDDRIILRLQDVPAPITLRSDDVVPVGFRAPAEILRDMKKASEASDLDALTDLIDEAFESGHDQLL